MMAFLVALNTTALLVGFVLRMRREKEVRRRLLRLEWILEAHGDSFKDVFRDDRDLAERIGRLELLTGYAKTVDFDDEVHP